MPDLNDGEQRVGDLTVRTVSDGGWAYPVDFVFDDAPRDRLSAALDGRLEPDGTLWTPYSCLLIDAPGHRVLVDTGFGGFGGPDGGTAGDLLTNLAGADVRPDDIDTVILSHAHVDHIGGLLRDGEPAFPRARHVMSAVEWATWTDEASLARIPPFLADSARAILPVLHRAGVVDLVDDDAEVVPGVHLRAAPGHTPGHGVVSVRSGGDQLLFLADAFLDELQVEHPEWTSAPDMDPETTVSTRSRLLDEAEADSVPVLAFHIGGIGRIERGPHGFRLVR